MVRDDGELLGVLVADDALGDRIPLEPLYAQVLADIGEVAERGGAVSDGAGGGDGRPEADAVDEVRLVRAARLVEVDIRILTPGTSSRCDGGRR